MANQRNACYCCSSKTGCLVIGWLEVFQVIPVIAAGVIALIMDPHGSGSYIGISSMGIASGYVLLVAACCLIYGVNTGRISLLIPYIGSTILKEIISFFVIIFVLGRMPIFCVLALIILALEIYKTRVVFIYFTDMNNLKKDARQMVSNPSAPPQSPCDA